MCGIFGSTVTLTENDIKMALAAISHRGPDSQGQAQLSVCGKTVTLAHTRLAILDLSENGHQPMQSRDGRWWVSFNGEIYNHLELRKQFDHVFRGQSDTETLVEHISRFGIEKTVSALNGMFAFAALDMEQGSLYLVRDPFGIKPVYYVNGSNGFSFASELKALLACELFRPVLDSQVLNTFLTLRYLPSPQTLFEDVSRLEPGHLLKIDLDSGRVDKQCYIVPRAASYEGPIDDAVNDYHAMLKQAVERQMLSDVPVGVLLSGGIDSAIVAALAAKKSNDIASYTVGFGSQHPECEIDDAAHTAKVLGIEHHSVEVTPDSLLDVIDDIVYSVEEPLGTTSIMPMWYLSSKAREGSTVVLTGQGNDEPWGGYRRYQIEVILAMFPFLKLPPVRLLGLLAKLPLSEPARRGLACLGNMDITSRFRDAYSLFNPAQRNSLTGSAGSGNAIERIDYWRNRLDCTGLPSTEQMMRIDTRMNLADDLLLYGDKISMSVALEARVPMLDIELVRFIESLPIHYRVTLSRTKIVHRLMCEKYLPKDIINRPKKGFQVPFSAWVRGEWRDYAEETLLNRNRRIYDYLHHEGVRQMWKHHSDGRLDYGKQLFSLLMLSVWMEKFVTGNP